MTKNQKEILKKLGYKETDEDGAILEHSEFGYSYETDCFQMVTIGPPRLAKGEEIIFYNLLISMKLRSIWEKKPCLECASR